MKTFTQFLTEARTTQNGCLPPVNQKRLLTEERDPRETIRKLMNLANRPGTVGEGEAARHQAETLAKQHGIDLDSLEKETTTAATSPAKAPSRTVDPFQSVLMRFGWRREYNPFYGSTSYVHPHSDFNSHRIEVTPNGWNHTIAGNTRYGGVTVADLANHLRFNVH